jgi:hypothetical protein
MNMHRRNGAYGRSRWLRSSEPTVYRELGWVARLLRLCGPPSRRRRALAIPALAHRTAPHFFSSIVNGNIMASDSLASVALE